jgi:predicted DNA-binding transcriptional regulator YafY
MTNHKKAQRAPATQRKMRKEALETGSAGHSRPPLARMLRLHQWLVEHRYPNCRKLADEFEVSPKTIQRDVNFMRDQMGLPIEYDRNRFGFHYTRPVSAFPALGSAASKGSQNPWRTAVPPAVGERPRLAAADGNGLTVRVRFDPESARMARSRAWQPSQVLHAVPGGGVDMVLKVRDEGEIARWVLSWGGHAWIIEPSRLKARIREMAREILARH